MKLRKELVDKLDNEEITNLQCITMHGKEMVENYQEWCSVLDFVEGDEEGAEQFINEIRYGDEPDGGDWPDEVWDEINKSSREIQEDSDSAEADDDISSVELLEKWKKDKGKLKSLRTSENAAKITFWRYQNPLGSKKACARELNITKKNVIKWWDVCDFIDGAIAGGEHVHPIRLEYDVIKRTILQAVEKAEKSE